MSELERMLERLGNVNERLSACQSEWAVRYWTQVRDSLRRRVELADLYDRGEFKESQLMDTTVLTPRRASF